MSAPDAGRLGHDTSDAPPARSGPATSTTIHTHRSPIAYRLPGKPDVPAWLKPRLAADFDRFKRGLPADVASEVREAYRVDLTGEYAGRPIRVPFGKASGQLSMTVDAVEADVAAGLGFVVLKTVIGEDQVGHRTMEPWAVRATAMKVEPIVSRGGRKGWTVTWKGRGWDKSFDAYLELYRAALRIGAAAGVPIAASMKCHLPPAGEPFAEAEYAHTVTRLAAVGGKGMIVEKDFSPTLAADARAASLEAIERWIAEVPKLIKARAPLTLGVKLMNALHGDGLQVEMVRAATASGADFLVLFNRLFDPKRGVAYGGWDLSDRNLRVLDVCQGLSRLPPISATGNICSGRLMAEYALRGATSGQIHTYFQLPLSAYPATAGSRSARALHALLFHPEEGLVAWMLSLGEAGVVHPREGLLHFLDVAHGAARHTD